MLLYLVVRENNEENGRRTGLKTTFYKSKIGDSGMIRSAHLTQALPNTNTSFVCTDIYLVIIIIIIIIIVKPKSSRKSMSQIPNP